MDKNLPLPSERAISRHWRGPFVEKDEMKTTDVRLKDGKTVSSVLWTFRPKEGFIELVDAGKIFLRDIESAVEKDVMVRYGVIEDVDLLKRAREQGWDGT